jgi:hypothetical protein
MKFVAVLFTGVGILFWTVSLLVRDPVWGPPLLLAGSILMTNAAIMYSINKQGKM